MTLKIGMNLNYYQNGDFNTPFLNKFKAVSRWMPNQFGSGGFNPNDIPKLHLDSNGYPLQAPGGGGAIYFDAGATSFYVAADFHLQELQTGNYVCLYSGSDGTESLLYYNDFGGVSGSKTGRDVINVMSVSNNGCGITIFGLPTGARAGGNLTNFALIYSPDSTATHVGVNEAAYLSDPYAVDPLFKNLFQPFDTFRMVDMTWNYDVGQAGMNGSWAQRPLITHAFWGISQNDWASGGATYANFTFGIGVPWEAQIHLCNLLNVNGWFNFPYNATSNLSGDLDYTYIDGVINIMKQGGSYPLNSNLIAYLEWNDEPWNGFPFPTVDSGNGAPAQEYYGLQGKAKYSTTDVPTTPYSWYSFVVQRMADRFQGAMTTSDFSRIYPVMGVQFTNSGTWDLALCRPGTSNYNGAGFVKANVKAYGIAPYFKLNDPIPLAWTADADGGLAKYFSGWNSDTWMPAGNGHGSVPVVTAGGGATSPGWTSCTVAAGPGTATNGSVICVNFPNASSGTLPVTLTANDGTAYPIQDYVGNNVAVSAGIQNLWFTNATSAGAATPGWRNIANNNYSSLPNGLGYASAGGIGWRQYIIDNMNLSVAAAVGTNQAMACYEFGFGSGAGNNVAGAAFTAIYNAQYSFTYMEPTYTDYLNILSSFSPLVANHYNAQRYYSEGSLYWGSVENILQNDSTSPKYDALLDFVTGAYTISPTSLPNGFVGVIYSQQIVASGGTPPYSYAVTLGALPNGLTLGANGVIYGAATATGTFNFTVTVTDSAGAKISQAYTVSPVINIVMSPSGAPTLFTANILGHT